MTVTVGHTPRYQWIGLSSDTKPTDGRVGTNDLFFETDTGNTFIYNGTAWNSFPSGSGSASLTNSTGFYIDYGNASLQGVSNQAGIIPQNAGGVGTNPIVANAGEGFPISGGYAKSNGVLSYVTFLAPNTINELIVQFVPQSNQAGGSNILAVSFGVQAQLAEQCYHCVIGTSSIGISLRSYNAGTEENILSLIYDRTLVPNGVTEYTVRIFALNDTLHVIGPNGEVTSITDARVSACAGRIAFFESPAVGNVWVRRFWGICYNATNVPSGFLSPVDIPAPVKDKQIYIGNNRGLAQLNTFNYNLDTRLPWINFGPRGSYTLFGNILAAINAGDNTFQCDELLPDGQYVLDFSIPSTFVVSSISNANPAVITTLTAHNFQNGDRVYFGGLTAPLSSFNASAYGNAVFYTATRLSSTTLSINLDLSGQGAPYTGGGNVLGWTRETVTTSGTSTSQGNSPFTINLSGTFARAHKANSSSVPVQVTNVTAFTSFPALGVDLFGDFVFNNPIILNGTAFLQVTDFSTRFKQKNQYVMECYNGGPGDAASLVVDGAIGTPATKSSSLTGAAGTVAIGNAISCFALVLSGNVTSITFTFPSATNIDGYQLTVLNTSSTFSLAAITWPASVVGGPAAIAANGAVTFKWINADSKWYLVNKV